TEFAGEEIALPLSSHDNSEHSMLPVVRPVQPMTWKEPAAPPTGLASLMTILEKLKSHNSSAKASTLEQLSPESAKEPTEKSRSPSHSPYASNAGGSAAGQ